MGLIIGCSGSPRLQRRKKGRHRNTKSQPPVEKDVVESVDELTYIDSLPEVNIFLLTYYIVQAKIVRYPINAFFNYRNIINLCFKPLWLTQGQFSYVRDPLKYFFFNLCNLVQGHDSYTYCYHVISDHNAYI